jgi:tetratricopeptide (TPR) repeat protein
LRIKEKAFGVDHINTANVITNLGNTYSRQGKYDEAIPKYERALRIYEECLPLHPSTSQIAFNIGIAALKSSTNQESSSNLKSAPKYLRKSVFTLDQEKLLADRFEIMESVANSAFRPEVDSNPLSSSVIIVLTLKTNYSGALQFLSNNCFGLLCTQIISPSHSCI